MGNIGFSELLVILLIVFVVFGAKRLPELGEGLGKAIRSFNKGMRGEESEESKTKSSKAENQINS